MHNTHRQRLVPHQRHAAASQPQPRSRPTTHITYALHLLFPFCSSAARHQATLFDSVARHIQCLFFFPSPPSHPPPPHHMSDAPDQPPPASEDDATAEPEAFIPYHFMYDPYGGEPRREDLDPERNESQYVGGCDGNPLPFLTFRELLLSMNAVNAPVPQPTPTSIKRWVRRALRRCHGVPLDSVTPSAADAFSDEFFRTLDNMTDEVLVAHAQEAERAAQEMLQRTRGPACGPRRKKPRRGRRGGKKKTGWRGQRQKGQRRRPQSQGTGHGSHDDSDDEEEEDEEEDEESYSDSDASSSGGRHEKSQKHTLMP